MKRYEVHIRVPDGPPYPFHLPVYRFRRLAERFAARWRANGYIADVRKSA